MKTSEFLRSVVTTDQGWFLLSSRDTELGWREHWYDWPVALGQVLGDAAMHTSAQRDVYFSAHLFAEQRSLKSAVLPTRTVQADLDEADVMSLAIVPTVIVRTSPQRHQGFWVVAETLAANEIERVARRIAYGVKECDRTGWPAGHRMRLPGTYNFKYHTPALVDITGHALKPIDLESFNLFPESDIDEVRAIADTDWITQGHTVMAEGPIEIMTAAKMSSALVTAYNTVAKDRSKALWNLMMACFRAGLDRDQTYWIASQSANNKFKDRHYNAVSDLRKDVVRAEAVAVNRELDVKHAIMDQRLMRGSSAYQRRLKMAEIVTARMREDGELVHTRGGQLWFMRRDTGRPVELSDRSMWFDAYLQRTFGLNPSETEARFVKAEVVNHVRNLAATADLTTLSFYDPQGKRLLLHTGGRDVLHIYSDRSETHPNGYGHMVFRVQHEVEPFKLIEPDQARAALDDKPWYEWLFGPQMEHIDGTLTKEEAVCLLRSWFLFLLFRSQMTNRPILAVMGVPGSGKTTTAKKLYRLLYGRLRYPSGLKDEDDFDTETINYPFVCYDNVDSYEKWLPDALARAASVTEVTKRKLYYDVDTVTQTRQALLMLTSHNPKFTREDVVDRLIVIALKRLPNWLTEADILEDVTNARNALWTDIIEDVRRILDTPMPAATAAPQFRIQDYARYGHWFAVAEDMGEAFHRGIAKLVGSQFGLNLESEQMLVTTIDRWLKIHAETAAKHGTTYEPQFKTAGSLWNEWVSCAPDAATFTHAYRSALQLGRKLGTLQNTLEEVFDITMKHDERLGTRQWKIAPKVPAPAPAPAPVPVAQS